MIILYLLAQNNPPSGGGGVDFSSPWWGLFNLGITGLMLVLILTNKLSLPREVKAAEDTTAKVLQRAELAEKILVDERAAHTATRELVFKALTEDVVPAIARATEVTSRATIALEGIRRGSNNNG